ncbi:C-X-C chemokine receptor type 3-like isoform X1 [Siniperca chuatsi]|uniref:C-X-C chemokine receptor type 3-like isoform X1 n=1 Tax=Siniperca chuatsi TaxID=119488 RepID=UPI001CE1D81F|nr:C-X-C chemokine receptor type 3-like isoform X1 [Siniperca chuatsi]
MDVHMLNRKSLLDGYDDLFDNILDNSSYNSSYEDYCCDGGDVCDLKDNMHFEAVFIPVLYSVVFVVGVLGNGVLLGVLIQSRRTWSVTDTFILHLGVADVILLVTLPFWAAQAVYGWTFGTPLCKITGSVFTVRGVQQERCTKTVCIKIHDSKYTVVAKRLITFLWLISLYPQINFYCGIFLLACISLDRYLSIVHATQMYSRRKPWVVQVSCLAVWLFSLLLSIPDWIFLEAARDDRRDVTECVPNYFLYSSSQSVRDWRLASRLLYHIVGFLLPSAVLIFCYSCILRQLRCGSQGLQKQKAFRVIVAVVGVFFLCWTPYNITLMVETIHSGESTNTCGVRSSLEKARIVTASVGYLHCSLNPILYAFVGVKFRRQLLDILRSLGCKLKTSAKFQSTVSSRRSSFWSESADTSNSIAI